MTALPANVIPLRRRAAGPRPPLSHADLCWRVTVAEAAHLCCEMRRICAMVAAGETSPEDAARAQEGLVRQLAEAVAAVYGGRP